MEDQQDKPDLDEALESLTRDLLENSVSLTDFPEILEIVREHIWDLK